MFNSMPVAMAGSRVFNISYKVLSNLNVPFLFHFIDHQTVSKLLRSNSNYTTMETTMTSLPLMMRTTPPLQSTPHLVLQSNRPRYHHPIQTTDSLLQLPTHYTVRLDYVRAARVTLLCGIYCLVWLYW